MSGKLFQVIMNNIIYEYEIPDPNRPVPISQRGVCGPSGELIKFTPAILEPKDVVDRTINELSTSVGTYGMGGAGFFGLRFDKEWLVIALWGASEWILVEGIPIEDIYYDDHNHQRPWITEECDTLSKRVVGQQIASILIRRHRLNILLTNEVEFVIEESPKNRPVLEGSKEPRLFSETDDLRLGLFLAPTTEIWI